MMMKQGIIAVVLVILAEVLFFTIVGIGGWAINKYDLMDFNHTPEALAHFYIFAGTMLINVLLLLLYIAGGAITSAVWIPLPRWTFWLLSLPWAVRLCAVCWVISGIFHECIAFHTDKLATEYFQQMLPYALGNFMAMATCFVVMEAVFNGMDARYRYFGRF